MSKLANIDVDVGGDMPPPAQWTDTWVRRRLVESYRIEQRLPGNPRRGTSTWPPIAYEFADVVGWDDARERVLDRWANIRGGVFAAELTRMEQAHEWLRVRLAGHPVERVCLAQWATAIAFGRPLANLMRQRKWPRSTFYRRVVFGSRTIAISLTVDGVPVT